MPSREEVKRVAKVLAEGQSARLRWSRSQREAADNAYHRASDWRDRSEVIGIGVGKKRVEGVPQQETSLVVAVKKKQPRARCDSPVPRSLEIPGVAPQVTTDVIEVGELAPQLATRQRERPALGGLSGSHPSAVSGTLGGLVRRDNPARFYILSAAHVIADYGLANVGDAVEQPAPADQQGSLSSNIGSLSEWIPYDFSGTGYPNRVDAAIATVPRSDFQSRIIHIGTPTSSSAYIREEMLVRKAGRTSGFTTGRVILADFSFFMKYKHASGQNRRIGFGNQVLCTAFTEPGDSGAFVFNHEKRVVGLHLAGSSQASVFSRIGYALRGLNVELVTSP